MAPRRKGSFDVTYSIEPDVSMPLDARQHVRTKEERLDPQSFPSSYKGLITASRDEEKLFFLVDHNNPSSEESWKEIGPYDDSEIRKLINEVDNRITDQTIEGGEGINVTRSGDNYTISYSGGTFPTDFAINGGDNVSVTKTGNAYTISATDNDTVTTVEAGEGVTITDTGTGGNHNYKVDVTGGGPSFPDDYMVLSQNRNLIITARSDNDVNIFTYDASIAGATAENNRLEEFETGKDKIRIRKTTLPEGTLSAWATSGAGIYYDASTGVISYNNGANVHTLVKVMDGSPVVPSDVTIIESVSPGPQPTKYIIFATSTNLDTLDEIEVEKSAGEHVVPLCAQLEERPAYFDVPNTLTNQQLFVYNPLLQMWQLSRDHAASNVTHEIEGETVQYTRWTDTREADASSTQVKVTWTV